jgi:hypothetical protein
MSYEFPYSLAERERDILVMEAMAWWEKHDPEKHDTNWGRGCLRCCRAVPAGWRQQHGCSKAVRGSYGGTGGEGGGGGMTVGATRKYKGGLEWSARARGCVWGGHLKWDGCIDLDMSSSHFCTPDELIELGYALDKLGAEHIVGWEGA